MSGADLASGVARFGRALRRRGVRVGVADEIDAAEALLLLGDADRDELRRALVITLKIRPEDRERFDAAFEAMWPHATPANPMERSGRAPTEARAAGAEDEAGEGAPDAEGDDAPGYSPEALLRRKPFEECSPADLAAMERLLVRLARGVATRRSRRRVPSRGRGDPDLRRSLRRAVATDGELLSLARRERPIETPRLVVLCDTSGSMDPHARFLLAFVLALRRAARTTEVFAFNTSLVRLTPILVPGGTGAIGPTLERLAARVPDWSGGTRIGECLEAFVSDHLRDRVDGRTVLLILSDGLDRGDTRVLADAMRAIHARARKVIWLNPLLGDPRYEPTARGMAAALPFVDELLPAHDLASLERLLPRLSSCWGAR